MSRRQVGIILDEVFTHHRPPSGHPERPDRILALLSAFEAWSESSRIQRLPPVALDADKLLAVHSSDQLETVSATRGRSASLDPDTHASPETYDTALVAAGSAVELTRQVVAGGLDVGFSLARPPGHHAERNRIMGFCFFNNIAAAAAWALEEGGLSRVAVVDFDVHHGNGTQQIFDDRSDVHYISNHQYPFYPGSGAATERGRAAGRNSTLNLPMPQGVGDAFVLAAYDQLVLPALSDYRPELILVSAGFDAHRQDPLGGLNMTAAGFGTLAAMLIREAGRLCEGRINFVLEGGYSLDGLTSSVLEVLSAALEAPVEIEMPAAPPGFAAYCQELERVWTRNQPD